MLTRRQPSPARLPTPPAPPSALGNPLPLRNTQFVKHAPVGPAQKLNVLSNCLGALAIWMWSLPEKHLDRPILHSFGPRKHYPRPGASRNPQHISHDRPEHLP